MRKTFIRAVIEVAFILFLFYANLLMGEFTHSGQARGVTLPGALADIFSLANLAIGIVAALVGYVVFEFLREML